MRFPLAMLALSGFAPMAAEAAIVTLNLRAVVQSSFTTGVAPGDVLTATIAYDDAVAPSGLESSGFAYGMFGTGSVYTFSVGSRSGVIPVDVVSLAERVDPDLGSTYSLSGAFPSDFYGSFAIFEQVPDGSFDHSSLVGALSEGLLAGAPIIMTFGEFSQESFVANIVPVPAALPLLATALAGVGGLAWRRSRR